MNVNKQLNSNDVDWPVVNGETINATALKNKGLSVIINQFREVDMPYKINGMELMIPVSMPVYEIRRLNLQGAIHARGGYTTVKVTKAGVNIIAEARCHASDHFNKSVGIKIATAKVVNELLKNGVLKSN
jgi:hypothetical protein